MAKHKRVWNEKVYIKKINAGYGQGTKEDYVPWICVQDFPSNGRCSRIPGITCNRIHHTLSRLETAFFYIVDYDSSVTDIQEQFPLFDILDTVKIAEEAGIRHPRDNRSHYPIVFTSDFVLTTEDGRCVRSIKPSRELKNKRTLEKLEVERRYWKYRDVQWEIVTEKDINFTRANNIAWSYRARDLPSILEPDALESASTYFLYYYENSTAPIASIANDVEGRYHLEPGQGLSVFQHLVLTHSVDPGLDSEIDFVCPRQPARKENDSWMFL